MLRTNNLRGPAALVALLLVSLAVAACGGSSTSTTTTTSTSETASGETTTATTSSPGEHTSTTATKAAEQSFSAYRIALTNYAACMRRHGVDLQPPKTSPSGLPVLGTPKNMNPKDPRFSAALLQCREYVIKITKVSPTNAVR